MECSTFVNGEQILNSDNRTTKLHSDNAAEHSDQSQGTQQDPHRLEPTLVNGHSEFERSHPVVY